MQLLNHEQCLELEPNLNTEVTAGLLCTSSYVVDPVRLTNKLVESAIANGAKLFLGTRVAGITKVAQGFLLGNITHHSRNVDISTLIAEEERGGGKAPASKEGRQGPAVAGEEKEKIGQLRAIGTDFPWQPLRHFCHIGPVWRQQT